MTLNLTPDPAVADDIYAAIVVLHEGLTPEESARAEARLILVLANHIGDPEIVAAAVAIARRGLRTEHA
jgi:hypothetical protein